MRDDLRGLAHLLHGVAQLADDRLLVRHAELDEVHGVAHEQAGVVEGVVELVGDPGSELAERGELSGLDELLLFVAQLLFAPLHLGRGLPEVAHHVDHGLPAVRETQVRPVRILKDVQQGSAGIVEPLGLASEPAAILLVVDKDVEHRLTLLAEPPVDLVEVAHDVEHRAALRVALPQAALQGLHLGAESALDRCARPGLRDRRLTVLRHHQSFDCFLRLASSFSRAIIFSSRPTTTSSNFSRSRIFSCNSLLDFSRSRTTCSYARMSRRMPMAPIPLRSGPGRGEALRVLGITWPLALRVFSMPLAVT